MFLAIGRFEVNFLQTLFNAVLGFIKNQTIKLEISRPPESRELVMINLENFFLFLVFFTMEVKSTIPKCFFGNDF